MKELLLILLCLHLLGDFYAQTETMANGKRSGSRSLLIHGAVYAVIMFAALLLVKGSGIWIAALVLGGFHLLIDYLKMRLSQTDWFAGMQSVGKDAWIFAIDQLLHIATIAITAALLSSVASVTYTGWLNDLSRQIHLSADTFVASCFLLLLIAKPANIAIKTCIGHYRPIEKEDEADDRMRKAGATIGTMERLLMLILLSLGQYAAIGLVLTAKSIVRYEKITKVPQFSEYYLMGTLASMLITIVAWLSVQGGLQ